MTRVNVIFSNVQRRKSKTVDISLSIDTKYIWYWRMNAEIDKKKSVNLSTNSLEKAEKWRERCWKEMSLVFKRKWHNIDYQFTPKWIKNIYNLSWNFSSTRQLLIYLENGEKHPMSFSPENCYDAEQIYSCMSHWTLQS